MSASRGQIGVDVGSLAIKFAVAGSGGAQIRTWGVIPRLEPGSEMGAPEAERLRSVLERRGIELDRIVVGAPPSIATSAVLELPPRSSGAPIHELARVELARIMRSEAEAIEAVCWDVPLGGKSAAGTTVMGVACPTEHASAIATAFERAGLRVDAIEPECLALSRACAAWCGVGSCILVDLGASSGRVSVIVGGRVAMERDLGELGVRERIIRAAEQIGVRPETMRVFGGTGIADPRVSGWRAGRECVEGLGAEIAEDAVRAIKESVAYVHGRANGASIERVCLCGWGTEIVGVTERVQAELGVEARVIRARTGETGADGETVTLGGVFALASGLAMRSRKEGRP